MIPCPDHEGSLAEVAFTVHDELQGKGIGTYLIRRLVGIARERGVKGFVGYVLASNARMLNLFHSCGFAPETSLDAGIYSVTMRFV